MADGGRSVRESDFVHDFPCTPCEQSGINVDGVKYCADCDENLCSTCCTHHNKLAITKGHNVLDQVQACKGYWKQHPSKQCRKHGGKIIDVYCPKHDSVGCSTCIAVEHRTCENIRFIPDVAADIRTSLEFKQLETSMKMIKSKLDSLRIQKGTNIQRLKKDKDSLRKEIQDVRKQLNSQLDKMEKELLDEAEEKFKQKIGAINASIAEIDSTLSKLEETMKQMKNDNQDSNIFITCKFGKQQILDEFFPKVKKLEHLLPEKSLELHTDKNIELILQGKRLFAAIMDRCDIENAEYEKKQKIYLSDDKNICCIISICTLPHGCLVMSDYNNKKLKKLDPVSKDVSKLITLPDNPTGLCLVDNTRLAVSLVNNKKIQFVTLGKVVTLGHKLSVGDRCRRLAYCDGLLYVCCGGSPIPKLEEGRGHVEVYNCAGDLLRCLYNGIQCPLYITVINDGFDRTMYISDHYGGVQIRSMDGDIKHQFPTVLNSDLPFCIIGGKHVCIGEYSTGEVYIHTCDDKRLLLEKKDLRGAPEELYFDSKSSKLFVAADEDNFIKIFDIKM